MKILLSLCLIVVLIGTTASDAFSADITSTNHSIAHYQYPELLDNFDNYLPSSGTHIQETDFVPEDEVKNRDTFYRQVRNSNRD